MSTSKAWTLRNLPKRILGLLIAYGMLSICSTAKLPTGDHDQLRADALETEGEVPFCVINPSGLYPNPDSCTTFIQCSNGVQFIQKCPSILVFNPILLVCDWPDNVLSCGYESPLPELTTGATPSTTTQVESKNADLIKLAAPGLCEGWGIYPNPLDCISFYACSDGDLFMRSCPAGTLFNPEISICDASEKVECNAV